MAFLLGAQLEVDEDGADVGWLVVLRGVRLEERHLLHALDRVDVDPLGLTLLRLAKARPDEVLLHRARLLDRAVGVLGLVVLGRAQREADDGVAPLVDAHAQDRVRVEDEQRNLGGEREVARQIERDREALVPDGLQCPLDDSGLALDAAGDDLHVRVSKAVAVGRLHVAPGTCMTCAWHAHGVCMACA